MANEIHVTPERLKATAGAFEGTNNQIQSLASQMTQIVTGLSGNVWTGEAASAYVQKFTALNNDIEKIHRMINEHVTDLQNMAQEYERAEQVSISEAQSLKSDVIA